VEAGRKRRIRAACHRQLWDRSPFFLFNIWPIVSPPFSVCVFASGGLEIVQFRGVKTPGATGSDQSRELHVSIWNTSLPWITSIRNRGDWQGKTTHMSHTVLVTPSHTVTRHICYHHTTLKATHSTESSLASLVCRPQLYVKKSSRINITNKVLNSSAKRRASSDLPTIFPLPPSPLHHSLTALDIDPNRSAF
jgi:hypothetical protein